jgi:hypothetical protein
MLRELPDAALQFLPDSSVTLLQAELVSCGVHRVSASPWTPNPSSPGSRTFGNPQTFAGNRYDKTRQPAGDPDCKLGCNSDGQPAAPAPTHNPRPAKTVEVGEFHWGYAPGVVATKVSGWGEFVLAELTRTFDKGDATYFPAGEMPSACTSAPRNEDPIEIGR